LIYTKKGDFENAVRNFELAIKLDPKLYYAYKELGDVYYIKRDYDRAIVYYNLAIAILPDYIPAYIKRGHAYEKKGDDERVYDNVLKMLAILKRKLNVISNPDERERTSRLIDQLNSEFNKKLSKSN
jgi:tetratricopeptide (TPR) repeat protein